MNRDLAISGLLTIALLGSLRTASGYERVAFVQQASQITRGMTQVDVLDLLGLPDDVWTQNDAGGLPLWNTTSIWCYGSDGHRTVPTLGRVRFDENALVDGVFGASGIPPDPDVIDEKLLQRLIRCIDEVPALTFHTRRGRQLHVNPRPLIQIVNALIPLGKDRAFMVLDEYARVVTTGNQQPPEELILVALALFEASDDAPPRPWIAWVDDRPRAVTASYPIVVVEDIPIFASGSIAGGGSGPMMQTGPTIEYFRAHGRLRQRVLRPPDDPIGVVARFRDAPPFDFTAFEHPDRSVAFDVMAQVVRLIETACPETHAAHSISLVSWGCYESIGTPGEFWSWIDRTCADECVWDPHRDLYVRRDGTWVDVQTPVYGRDVWRMDRPGRLIRLISERRGPDYVALSLECLIDQGAPRADFTRLVVLDMDGQPLHEFSFPWRHPTSGSSSTRSGITLPEGASIRVRLTIDRPDGRVIEERVFTP